MPFITRNFPDNLESILPVLTGEVEVTEAVKSLHESWTYYAAECRDFGVEPQRFEEVILIYREFIGLFESRAQDVVADLASALHGLPTAEVLE